MALSEPQWEGVSWVPVITLGLSPTPEHVRGGGGELHLCGLEEGLPNHLHAGRQQRARGGRPGGPDAQHPLGESAVGEAGLLSLWSKGAAGRTDYTGATKKWCLSQDVASGTLTIALMTHRGKKITANT